MTFTRGVYKDEFGFKAVKYVLVRQPKLQVQHIRNSFGYTCVLQGMLDIRTKVMNISQSRACQTLYQKYTRGCVRHSKRHTKFKDFLIFCFVAELYVCVC